MLHLFNGCLLNHPFLLNKFYTQTLITMKIAIIGAGNVGGALAINWHKAGHTVILGTRNEHSFKVQRVVSTIPEVTVTDVSEAARQAEVLLISTPSAVVLEIIEQIGDVKGKVIIDATNTGRRPEPYPTAYHALVAKTKGEIVKCFNATGAENILDPIYDGEGVDMFMAGDSAKAKKITEQLAKEAGFSTCWDFGSGEKVLLLEQFAFVWINLAITQGHGRQMAFKLLKR
jgi:hypothetical protein